MLDADTLVPLRMKSNPSDALSLVDKNDLGNLRHYLWSMRGLPNEAIFKDEIIANIQDRMVSMRQKDKNLGPKDFHRLLNLSKLMAASYGRPMELADWDRVQALDAERMVRLSLS